jgi:hypothetical protein
MLAVALHYATTRIAAGSWPGGVSGVEVHVIGDLNILPDPTLSFEQLDGEGAFPYYSGAFFDFGKLCPWFPAVAARIPPRVLDGIDVNCSTIRVG